MSHKFTSDGRKVAIIGALNAKETIVQEIFVTDGTEFPAGEHFVVKTLLDAPAETYKAREEKRVLESIKKLEGDRDRLAVEIKGFRFKSQAAAARIKWISGVTDNEVQGVFDNLQSMMTGEYTHVVLGSGEIKEWGPELFARSDDYHRGQFESLRLISLFGEWNGRLKMDWRVNTYQDGSGSSSTFFPCRSLQEAVEKAKEIIYAKEHLSDDSHALCLKYGIPVDEAKNAARLADKTRYIRKQIADSQERITKLEADLVSVA
jgi:hypothetical protein